MDSRVVVTGIRPTPRDILGNKSRNVFDKNDKNHVLHHFPNKPRRGSSVGRASERSQSSATLLTDVGSSHGIRVRKKS